MPHKNKSDPEVVITEQLKGHQEHTRVKRVSCTDAPACTGQLSHTKVAAAATA